jgi:hypothetical protein
MGQCYAYAHNRLNRLFFFDFFHPPISPRSDPGGTSRPTDYTDPRPHREARAAAGRQGHHQARVRDQRPNYEASRELVRWDLFLTSQANPSAHCRLKLPASPARRNACWVAWPFRFWFGWEVRGPPHATLVVSEILTQHHVPNIMYTQAHAQSAHAALMQSTPTGQKNSITAGLVACIYSC